MRAFVGSTGSLFYSRLIVQVALGLGQLPCHVGVNGAQLLEEGSQFADCRRPLAGEFLGALPEFLIE
jgi:hypothetical protein